MTRGGVSDPWTDPQGDRWHGEAVADEGSFVSCPAPAGSVLPIPRRRQPPPTHCGALHRNGRDLIIATRPAHQPLSSHCCQRQRRKRYKRSLNRQCYPPHFMREYTPPNLHDPQRAKGPLDRRSKRLSFPHFFLRRKKCGRRRPPPRQGKIDSPPQRRKRFLCLRRG